MASIVASAVLCRAVPAKKQASNTPQVDAVLPRVKGALVAGAAAALRAAAPAKAADLALGEEVFGNNCAACHMGGQNSVMPDKTLQKAALEQYLAGGFTGEAIVAQVENGKGAVPAWAGRLSEEEIEGVAAYVYKQAAGSLW